MFKKLVIHKNIDELMIDNFKGMLQGGDLSNMFHFENVLGIKTAGKIRVFKRKKYNELNDYWISCYNEYLKVFGLNRLHLQILDQEDKIALLKIKMHKNNHLHLGAIIKSEERRLEEMSTPDKKKKSFEEDIVMIQKHQKIPIDGKTTTTRRFFTYVKLMEAEADEIRAKNARKDR